MLARWRIALLYRMAMEDVFSAEDWCSSPSTAELEAGKQRRKLVEGQEGEQLETT